MKPKFMTIPKKHLKIKSPKAFNIKKTDSIEKIDEMQRELKDTINKLQELYDGIQKFRDEKAFKETFNE